MAEPQPQQPRRPLTIRHATQTDAPHLKRLLRLSYERFSELQMPHDKIESMISKTQELFDDIAGRILKDQDDCILVGEIDGSVVGMAAVTRSNKHEGAVQYVSIDPPVQRQGVGRSLDQAIVEWAQPRFSRLVLWTGYEWAREFYQAMGFQVVRKIPMSGPDANANANAVDQQPPQRFVYQMARHINHHGLVRKVVVVGGTHGNERIGSALAHKWANHPELLHRATLESSIAIISNREAVRQNVRFIDEDLNRCFTVEAVSKARSADDPSTLSYEMRLTRELDQQLGPKHLGRPGCEAIEASKRCKSDFIIDAHSTTSNMGLTLVASPADAFALRVAAHIAFRFPDKNIRIIGPPPESFDFSLITIAPSGLGIEVGPLAHGTLDFKLMQDTEMMVQAALDFIDQHNSHILAGNIDRPLLPRRSHHQGEGNDDESLPSCIEFFEFAEAITYEAQETDTGVRHLQVVHPDRDRRDFEPIEPGAPLLLNLEPEAETPTNQQTDDAPTAPSTPSDEQSGSSSGLVMNEADGKKYKVTRYEGKGTKYPLFVNEAAYFKANIAMRLTIKKTIPIY